MVQVSDVMQHESLFDYRKRQQESLLFLPAREHSREDLGNG